MRRKPSDSDPSDKIQVQAASSSQDSAGPRTTPYYDQKGDHRIGGPLSYVAAYGLLSRISFGSSCVVR